MREKVGIVFEGGEVSGSFGMGKGVKGGKLRVGVIVYKCK